MANNKINLAPFAGFLILGAALLVLGINTNRAFIGVGALFLLIGLTFGLKKRKKDDDAADNNED